MKYETYKKLQAYEKQLISAKTTNYARFPHKNFVEFSKIVEEWRGTEMTKNERSCSACLLKLLKAIAEDYFKYQNSPRGQQKIKKEEENNVEEEGNGKEE